MGFLTELAKRARGDRVVTTAARRQLHELTELSERVRSLDTKTDPLSGVGIQVTSIAGQLDLILSRVETMSARLDRIEADLRRQAAAVAPGTSNREAWATGAQVGELKFHARNNSYRGDDEAWQTAVDRDWRALGLQPDVWTGRTVLDIGAGSRSRALWFSGTDLLVIEPLADRFREEVPFCDLDRASEVYSVPGEVFVPELEHRADVIVSINALDHGYDLAASVANLRRYLKPDGMAVLSLDLHDKVSDEMHPMIVTDPMMLTTFAHVGLEVVQVDERERYHGGTGPGARTYWLRPAEGSTPVAASTG